MAMLAGRERIEGIQQIEVAWSRVPGAESTRLHTAHPKPVPLLLVHSLAHSPYPTFFLYRLFDSPSCPPADTHPHYSFPLIPFLTVISSLCFSSLLFSSLLFSSLVIVRLVFPFPTRILDTSSRPFCYFIVFLFCFIPVHVTSF